jgi:exodeoxyribonuclease VII small subunit
VSDDVSYADAIAELEAIVTSLERDDLDVDALSTRVARAAALIKLCRDRIGGTRIEIERLVADLEPPDASS